MTDFYSVLQRAVATLPDRSGPQRRQVYEKARKALLKQLQSFDPPLPSADVTAQRLALEDAIRKIENEIARANRARRAVAGAMPASGTLALAAGNGGAAVNGAAVALAPQPPREVDAEREARRRAEAERARADQLEQLNAAVSDAAIAATEPPPVAALPAPVAVLDDDDAADEDDEAPDFRPEVELHAVPLRRAGRPEPSTLVHPHDAEFEEVVDADLVEDDAVADAEPEPAEDARADKRRRRQEERAARAARRGRKRADTATPAAVPGRASRVRSRRGLALRVAVPALALALIAGGAYAAFAQRDRLMALVDSVAKVGEPRAPIAGATSASLRKNEDRLDVAGEETRTVATTPIRVGGEQSAAADADPNAALDAGADGGDGTDEADGGDGAEAQQFAATASDPAAVAAAGAASTPAPAAAAPPAGEPPVAVGSGVEQAVLYEEAAAPGAQGGSAVRGSVAWSIEKQALGGGAPESVVKAVVRIDGRDLTATITIRENTDSGLPASHLIEIQFTTPDGFEGGGIKNVPGVIMKETEEARGDALRGAAARVSSGLFWIALSQVEADEQKNLDLLRSRDWIDIPILYENGRRAILTLSKGAEGLKSVNAAIKSWANG